MRDTAVGNGGRCSIVTRSSERWADASVTIAGGRVIATPVETDEIYCLDLLTGKALWPTVKRGNRRFVAAVHENHVILVGRSEIAALDLADGHQVWSTAFRGMPSGRGFSSGEHYYLATTAPELLKIDLTNGEIVDRTLTDEPLGNLLAYQDQILAQGTRWVVSFYQTERLRELVDSKLRQHPDDPWSLEHLGMLLLEEGRQRQGLDALLRQAFERIRQGRPPPRGRQEIVGADSVGDAARQRTRQCPTCVRSRTTNQ